VACCPYPVPAHLPCPCPWRLLRYRRDDVSTWPLVRVCRLRHNWPVLATGAMLVDLPGVRDANAARGKVAENYLKARSLSLLEFCAFSSCMAACLWSRIGVHWWAVQRPTPRPATC
jgi:hypothetical protein